MTSSWIALVFRCYFPWFKKKNASYSTNQVANQKWSQFGQALVPALSTGDVIVFAFRSHQLNVLFSFVVIGHCDCFGYCFTTFNCYIRLWVNHFMEHFKVGGAPCLSQLVIQTIFKLLSIRCSHIHPSWKQVVYMSLETRVKLQTVVHMAYMTNRNLMSILPLECQQ